MKTPPTSTDRCSAESILPSADPASVSSSQALALDLCRTSNYLARRMHAVLDRFSLTCGKFHVLRALSEAGGHGVSCGGIAERMITSDPDVTRMLDRMQREGLVRRRRSTQDRRVVLTSLTEKGEQLLQDLREPMQATFQELLGGLSESEQVEFMRLLAKVCNPQEAGAIQSNSLQESC